MMAPSGAAQEKMRRRFWIAGRGRSRDRSVVVRPSAVGPGLSVLSRFVGVSTIRHRVYCCDGKTLRLVPLYAVRPR